LIFFSMAEEETVSTSHAVMSMADKATLKVTWAQMRVKEGTEVSLLASSPPPFSTNAIHPLSAIPLKMSLARGFSLGATAI
jgi:hypothetical protein